MSSNIFVIVTGRADGGGASRGITGDAGVGGRGAGEGEVDVVPLNPAKIAGTGVAIAIWNDGGAAKYPSSMSGTGSTGGVGGGLSAYEEESESPLEPPCRRDDHSIDGTGAPSRPLVCSFEGDAGGE